MKMERLKLGDLLLQAGMITEEQLNWALEYQKTTGKRLGDILQEQGWLAEVEILEALEYQLGIPYLELAKQSIDQSAAQKIPESIARRYVLVGVEIENKKLKVAMSDPLNVYALDDLKISTGMDIMPVISSKNEILLALNQVYASAKTTDIVSKVEQEIDSEKTTKSEMDELVAAENNSAMVQLVNNIIQRSVLSGASDIHIEPFEDRVRIRYRVDGQLQKLMTTKKETLNPLTARIKIMAGLDIAERRLPQDGRIATTVEDKQVDLRVSILPTIYGEKTVIRIMYRDGISLSLDQLGFHPEDLEKFKNLLRNPHGIILVTGPTGSGKSTTLAAALKVLNKENVNIITAEDPVENMIDGVNQVAINSRIGLTFASTLRSILRQDPDIVMIGEMRDSETSSIAIRAAITGHLVLSTLHTNDAVSSIIRLIDMGTEAFMVGASVKGIVSQRLVRRICPNCKVEHSITKAEEMLYKIPEGTRVYKGLGCNVCNNLGYKGRMAVHEIFMVDSYMQELIGKEGITADKLKEEAIKRGMRTMWENAYYNVLAGNTTVEEMLRIAYEQ
jgi:type IV pilus assembly protein PilB